jgi:hypothetical protein
MNGLETVNREDEFSVDIQEKTEATNAEYAAPIFKRKTPRTIRGVKRIRTACPAKTPALTPATG